MADIMTIHQNIALIVGGTQPDPINHPYFYSGSQVNDGTGLAGVNGCFAAPPSVINCEPPYGILMLRDFTDGGDPSAMERLTYGQLFREDTIQLKLCVPSKTDTFERQYAAVMNLRDLLNNALAAKLTASSSPNVWQAWAYKGRWGHFPWASIDHFALELDILVKRDVLGQTFTA